MEIPFAVNPKAPQQKLFDILLQAPTLMERADRIQTEFCLQTKLDLCFAMAKSIWELDAELEVFYSDLAAQADGPLYWPILCSESSEDGEVKVYPFPIRLEFIDQRLGALLMIFWASQVVMWSGLCDLYYLIDRLKLIEIGIMPDTPHSKPKLEDMDAIAQRIHLPLVEHRKEFIVPTRNVCHSVEYVLAHDHLSLPAIIAPLNMISQVMADWPGCEPEVEWARKCQGRLYKQGVKLAKHYDPAVQFEENPSSPK